MQTIQNITIQFTGRRSSKADFSRLPAAVDAELPVTVFNLHFEKLKKEPDD